MGKLPELDDQGTPKFAYGRVIHEDCPRRAHFDAGRFAGQFGDEYHRQGYCLYRLGCKGPATHASCSIKNLCEVPGAWPIGVGAPCFGCTEKSLAFRCRIRHGADRTAYRAGTHSPESRRNEGRSALWLPEWRNGGGRGSWLRLQALIDAEGKGEKSSRPQPPSREARNEDQPAFPAADCGCRRRRCGRIPIGSRNLQVSLRRPGRTRVDCCTTPRCAWGARPAFRPVARQMA